MYLQDDGQLQNKHNDIEFFMIVFSAPCRGRLQQAVIWHSARLLRALFGAFPVQHGTAAVCKIALWSAPAVCTML